MARIVHVCGEIATGMAMSICSRLREYNQEDPEKPIIMFINSPGGSVFAAQAILDVANTISAPVIPIVYGMAASAASFILTCLKTQQRFASPNSYLMYHEPRGFQELDVHSKHNFLATKDRLLSQIAACSGRSLLELEELCKFDYWITADEAVSQGFIDEVLDYAEPTQNDLESDDDDDKERCCHKEETDECYM